MSTRSIQQRAATWLHQETGAASLARLVEGHRSLDLGITGFQAGGFVGGSLAKKPGNPESVT